MTSCTDVDRMMTPFVDGELGAADTAEVEQHLAACPPCRDRSTTERAARKVIRTRVGELDALAPDDLRAACAAAARAGGEAAPSWSHRALGWVPLSVAATLLLAVGGVFVLGQNDRLEAAFVAQLALDHDRCFGEVVGTADTFGQTDAEAVLVSFGWNLSLPAESSDFNLVDVRRCLHDGGDMAHVLCEWHGQPVSLFIAPGRASSDRSLEIMGRHAVTWGHDEGSYVLVAKGVPVDLGHVAAYVRQYTD